MRAILQWHTRIGNLTTDNRDAYAHLDLPQASFYLVADGSSRHPGSGELATALLAELTQGIGRLPATALNRERLPAELLQLIDDCRRTLCETHPHAACSYLVLCLLADTALSIHEGDCCLGLVEAADAISWLTPVHCMANWQGNLAHAELAQMPSRHRLTRCFSSRRVGDPEIRHWPLAANQRWLLATDGFWAGLSTSQQQHFLHEGHLNTPPTDDDISCLSIITSPIP